MFYPSFRTLKPMRHYSWKNIQPINKKKSTALLLPEETLSTIYRNAIPEELSNSRTAQFYAYMDTDSDSVVSPVAGDMMIVTASSALCAACLIQASSFK